MVVSVGMSLLITKSPPPTPCFFSNHSIKEMSAPKPYLACFPYTQVPNLSLLLVAFHSRLLRSLFTSASLQCAGHGKEECEDHPMRKYPPSNRSSEKPLSNAAFVGNFPSFSWKGIWKKSTTWTLPNLRESCCSGQKRSDLPWSGGISSDQHSLKHYHLSHLTPSPFLKKYVHSWKAAGSFQQLSRISNEMCVWAKGWNRAVRSKIFVTLKNKKNSSHGLYLLVFKILQ